MSSKTFFVFGAVVAAVLLVPNAVSAGLLNPLDPYTFEGVAYGQIHGVDGWDGTPSTAIVSDGPAGSVNTSKVAGTASIAEDWLASTNAQIVSGTVTQTCQLYSTSPSNDWSFAGAVWSADISDIRAFYGVDGGKWTLWTNHGELKSTATSGADMGPVASHWYELKLVTDLTTTDGGVGALYYRDLTDGQTSFNAIPGLTSTALGLSKIDGNYELTGIGLYLDPNNGNPTYVDNFNAVPEPSVFALLTTALFGLLAYAWRKRR